MNKNYVFRSFGLLLAVAALSFAACGKKSSSSSSSGTTSGALGGLSALSNGTGALSVNGLKPQSGGVSCTGTAPNLSCNCANGGTMTLSGSWSPATPACSAPYTTPGTGVSGSITETASNCNANGYTYNGTITFGSPGTAISGQTSYTNNFVYCTENSSNYSMTGSFGLNSSSMSITGNSVNMVGCNVAVDSSISDIASGGTPTISGAVSWKVTGGNCPTTSGSSSF